MKTKTPHLPEFSKMTLEEISRFWDSHDSSDFWGQMEEVKVSHKPRANRCVSLRIPLDDLQRIKRIAAHKGLGHTTVMRSWVREKLHSLTAHAA